MNTRSTHVASPEAPADRTRRRSTLDAWIEAETAGDAAGIGETLADDVARVGPLGRDRVAASLPVRRIGRPQEVAAAAVWLCGPDAGFITGATLPVDGGLLAGMPPYTSPPGTRDGPEAAATASAGNPHQETS